MQVSLSTRGSAGIRPIGNHCWFFPMHSDNAGTRCPQESRRKIDKRSWDYILRSGIAGGLAGCAAKTAIAPLDRVKILFQAHSPEYQKYSGALFLTGRWLGVVHAGRRIIREQGVLGLFQGHSATLLRIFPYAAIKYMAYDTLHSMLMPTSGDETPQRLFLAGSLSGVLSVFVTYPLELVRVRLAFDTRNTPYAGSLSNIVRKIYTEGTAGSQTLLERYPIFKFYRGFSATVMGMIPYAGTSFLVFGRCKALLYAICLGTDTSGIPVERPSGFPQLRMSRTMVDLSSGAIAGAISQTMSYPFEVIRRRQQVGGLLQPERMLGIADTARWIYTNHGIRGFFVGLSIGYIKVVPMTAISFAVWSGVKRQLGV